MLIIRKGIDFLRLYLDVLKFQKSVGQDAESADMNGSSDLEELWVQVQVILQPGNAIFDSTLKYKVVEKLFSLEVSEAFIFKMLC